MKFLFVLLIFNLSVLNSLATTYMPHSKIDGNIHFGLTLPLNKKKCELMYGEPCIGIPFNYNPSIHELIDERVADLSKPIYEAKSNVVTCSAEADNPLTEEVDESLSQQEDCIAKESNLTCNVDEGYFKVRVADNSEVYCTKISGYEKKLTGNKVIVANEAKKALWDAAQSLEKDKKNKVRNGKKRRSKCQDALNYVSGANQDRTEAENDALELAFSSIQDALVKCRYKKAKRLIGEVSDPAYSSLKNVLLEILE